MNNITFFETGNCRVCAKSYPQEKLIYNNTVCSVCLPVFLNYRTATPKANNFSCFKCGETETPQRRSGPDGRSELCNRCGLAYRKALQKQKKAEARAHNMAKMSISFLMNPQENS